MRHPPDGDVLSEGSPDAGPPPDPSVERSTRRWFPLALALVVVAVDQGTKEWALAALDVGSCARPGNCIDVLGPLRFNLTFNRGASFSSFENGGPVLALIAAAMSVYLMVLADRASDAVLRVAYAVVAGGAVGNLVDRIVRADDGPLSGAVVDFVDLQFWPIFNVADVAVVGGVLVVAFRLLRTGVEP